MSTGQAQQGMLSSPVPLNPEDIATLVKTSYATVTEQQEAERCLRQLKKLAQSLDGEWCVRPFGSSANGFAVRGSDFDVTCYRAGTSGQDNLLAIHELQTRLLPLLHGDPSFELTEAIWSARVPILKLKFEGHLEVDLSCQNSEALLNTELLKAYSQLHPAVRDLVVLVKLWTRSLGLSGARNGYLSSYTWTLMVVYFLQVHPALQMPCLSTEAFRRGATAESLQKPAWKCDFLPHRLLHGFFDFFTNPNGFKWGAEVVSVRLGTRVNPAQEFVQLTGRDSMRLHVEDPFLLSRNLNCVLGWSQEGEMHSKMKAAAAALGQNLLPEGMQGLIVEAAIAGYFKPQAHGHQSDSEGSTALPNEVKEARCSDSDIEEHKDVISDRGIPSAETVPLPKFAILEL
mmetsp:Transcript_73029/g.171235  ORF Transcript_73029/g.171235 Transcript_73029/m.171235 type:complete len:400 (+) Transcript_73029:86-1285(+)